MYFTELVVCCFIALTIPDTNEFEIGPRYLVNGMDPCGGRCKQGHCSPEGNGTYKCVCMSGWAGTDCGILAWTLTTAPGPASNGSHNLVAFCNHHGTWNGYSCHCLDNWSGDRCQFATDPCFDKCVHGRCVQFTNNTGYYCDCDDSWQGKNCDSGTMLHCGHTYCVHGSCVSTIGPHGPENSHCECYHGWQGHTCEVSSSATTTKHTPPPVTVKSTHSPSTLITATHAHGVCNKGSAILDILQQNLVDNKNASLCPSGSHTSHEAFVLKNCPASAIPASWQPGAQVMAMCNGGPDSFPGYTAIAAFDNGRYAAVGGLSGILVGCLADGFKMAAQRCDHPPLIKEIHVGGSFLDDPNVYFTIV